MNSLLLKSLLQGLGRLRRYRTVILAVLAALAFGLSAVFTFDVDPAALGQILLYSLAMLAVAMLAALLMAGPLTLLKRLFSSKH